MSQGGAMTDTHEDARPRGPGAAMKAGGPSTTSCTSPNVKPQHLCGASSVPLQAALAYAHAGPPVPPFVEVREEARDWAAFASPGELRAYLSASWNRLPEVERARFLSAARPKQRRAAA